MIYLGANMWHGPDSLVRFNKNDPRYYTELYTSRDAWRKITDYAAETGINTLLIDIGEGLQFESHPEIACKGAWTKQEMKAEIERLKKLGITCIPKLNFASTHDEWMGDYSRMLGTPTYDKVVKDLIDETCELFQPPLFHFGYDEESRREIHMQNSFGYSAYRFGDVYWNAFNDCVKHITANGVRPWAWGGLVHFHADEFFKYMSKDIVVSTYNYGQIMNLEGSPDYKLQQLAAPSLLEKYGYDQIPTCSTCYDYTSVDDSLCVWKKEISSKHMLGILTAPWYRTGDEDIYTHFAEAKIFLAARKKYFPEEV